MLLPLYILAGGHSSRFGSDKARAEVGGRPLIVRLVESLARVSTCVTVIAPRGRYADLGLTSVPDEQPGLGPLGGLLTALEHARGSASGAGWLMLASCDIVQVAPGWFEHLASHRRDGAHAVVMRDEHWQSLAAIYHTDLLPAVRHAIETGHLAMHHLLEAHMPHVIAVTRPTHLTLRQANTPADLRGERGG